MIEIEPTLHNGGIEDISVVDDLGALNPIDAHCDGWDVFDRGNLRFHMTLVRVVAVAHERVVEVVILK